MLLLRACPHCHGDLALEEERDCGYLSCVQCGHILSRFEERALGVTATQNGIRHVVALRPKHPPMLAEERHPTLVGSR
jgi:Zn ribbon nucleic-acid-binding protein